MIDSVIRLEKDEQVAIITLNRPKQLNAFNAEMRDQLHEIMLAIRDDPSVEAIVLCGMGRGFCAGADLTEFGTEPTIIKKRRVRLQQDLWEEIRRTSKPIAAALHGFAVGSGLEMAMLCDFRFAAPETKLSLPESQLGMIAAAGGTQSLPRLLKQGLALDVALGGHTLSAEEGYKLGLISQVVPLDNLIGTTVRYMKKIVGPTPRASRWIKTLAAHSTDMPLPQGLARERILASRAWNLQKQERGV